MIISSRNNIPTSIIFYGITSTHFRESYYKCLTKIILNKVKILKILNNVLYLDKKLHAFGLSNMQLSSFCKMEEETISNLFYYYRIHIQNIWNQVRTYFTDCLHLSVSTRLPFSFIPFIMTLFLFRIKYYFYSNYIYIYIYKPYIYIYINHIYIYI